MSSTTRKELQSERLAAGSRTYFFDVKQAADGTKYLVISESRQAGEKWEHHRVMVFAEQLEQFLVALEKAVESVRGKRKASPVEAIRKKYPRAYEPWSAPEDSRLKARYNEGFSIPELARVFQRQESAIRSRLAKLGTAIGGT